MTSGGTGSNFAAPARKSPGASSRSHHARRIRPGTQISGERRSIARRIACDTADGGSLAPRNAVGSSVFSQISVSIGPTWTTHAWTFEPARSSHRPSVSPVRPNFDAA